MIILLLERSHIPKQEHREPNNAELHPPRCIGCHGLLPQMERDIRLQKHN